MRYPVEGMGTNYRADDNALSTARFCLAPVSPLCYGGLRAADKKNPSTYEALSLTDLIRCAG